MHFLGQPASYGKKKTYEVHEVLGEGTFGKVVRSVFALDHRTERARRGPPASRAPPRACKSLAPADLQRCLLDLGLAIVLSLLPGMRFATRRAARTALLACPARPSSANSSRTTILLVAPGDDRNTALVAHDNRDERCSSCSTRAHLHLRAFAFPPSRPRPIHARSPPSTPITRPQSAAFFLTRLARTNSPPVAFLAAKHDALNELFTTALTAQQSRVGQFSGTNGSRYLLETNGSPCSTATTRS